MEALETFAVGDAGVRSVGCVEYFEEFSDVIDDDRPWDWRAWSTFTPDEVRGLDEVLGVVLAASVATPARMDDDAFIRSGWPVRIRQVQRPGAEQCRTCRHDQPPPGGEAWPASTIPCETACRPRKNGAVPQSVFRYRSHFSRLLLLPFLRWLALPASQ